MTARLWGLGAALAFAAQIVFLRAHGPAALLLAGTLTWASWQIWRYRDWLGPHVDMIVLMCGYGGLGMMLGAPHCHDTAQGWFEMTAGMLALGLAPVFFGSRCFGTARRRGNALVVLLFDTLGMAAGMGAVHLEMSFVSPSPLLKHFVMIFGMAAGMIAGSIIGAACSKRSPRKALNISYASNNHSLSR